MIFTKVDALVKDIDVDKYHIETVILSSDDPVSYTHLRAHETGA